ncbi:hypothetical protein SAMN05444405_1231 [Bacteroides luti]|uniref:Uncharacterized protein n=2 Tax=Bacteroides luti TaxID=1297750 RepID=A0A1M5GYG1_9BACE|nr:hypothetical protein SAMN05444405_1231 [Bacteroides luti]
MRPLLIKINLMLRERTIKIHEKEYLTDALKREGFAALPTNCVINKVLPGLGATYCELTSPRKSIIIEPNVPVIVDKAKKHKHTLAVHKGVMVQHITDFLEKNGKQHYKILTTPESFQKVKEAMEALQIDMYSECFMLFDECEKLVQDVDYRGTISGPMSDFFLFQYKAMVSATPIIAEDERLVNQGFRILKVVPTYDYKKKMKLITTNNICESLVERLTELKITKKSRVCIFTNSIDTIDSLFVDVPDIQDCYTFCSEESTFKLWKAGKRKKSTLIDELMQFNFFTSRFFSAVDIISKIPPHVILISDMYGAPQSAIDPKTEAIQIVGRFRNGVKSITHISSIRPNLEYKSEPEIKSWLQGAEDIYNDWQKLLKQTTNDGKRTLLREALGNNSFLPYLDNAGKPDPFLVSNLYEAELVKSLYTYPTNLYEAYRASGFFNIEHEPQQHLFSDDDRLALHRQRTRKGRMAVLLLRFEALEKLRTNPNEKAQKKYHHLLSRLITGKDDQTLYSCYEKLGSKFIREKLDFNVKAMERSINKQNEHAIKKSFAMRNAVHQQFEIGDHYSRNEIKVILTQVYKRQGVFVNSGVTSTEINRWFEVERVRKHDIEKFKILKKKD